MKGIGVLCVGKIKEGHFRDGIAHYEKMIRRSVPLEILECPDQATPDKAVPAQEEEIRRIEGGRILARIREDDYVIALCIDGKSYDSPAFASRLKRRMGSTQGRVIFVIGGSLGLSREVLGRADEKLSFSSMTFPHQMMRMILLEQLERALTSS